MHDDTLDPDDLRALTALTIQSLDHVDHARARFAPSLRSFDAASGC